MSWFHGQIPGECRECFRCTDGIWQMNPDVLCDDRCDHYLFMFPILNQDGSIDHVKMDVLSLSRHDPVWFP